MRLINFWHLHTHTKSSLDSTNQRRGRWSVAQGHDRPPPCDTVTTTGHLEFRYTCRSAQRMQFPRGRLPNQSLPFSCEWIKANMDDFGKTINEKIITRVWPRSCHPPPTHLCPKCQHVLKCYDDTYMIQKYAAARIQTLPGRQLLIAAN